MTLTDHQRTMARKHGLSEDEYAAALAEGAGDVPERLELPPGVLSADEETIAAECGFHVPGKLTPHQREIAAKHGLTDEEYLALRDEG